MSRGGGTAGTSFLLCGLALVLGACDLEPPRDVSPVTPFVRPDPTSASSPRPDLGLERPPAPLQQPTAPPQRAPTPGDPGPAPATAASPPEPTDEELVTLAARLSPGAAGNDRILRALGERPDVAVAAFSTIEKFYRNRATSKAERQQAFELLISLPGSGALLREGLASREPEVVSAALHAVAEPGPDELPALLRLLGDRRHGRDADSRLARLFRSLARRSAEPPDRKLVAAAAKLMAAGKARGGPLAAAPATLLLLGLYAEQQPDLKLAGALYLQGRAATARLGGATGPASKPGPELDEEPAQLDLALRHQLAMLAWHRGRKADARRFATGFSRVADDVNGAANRLENLGAGWPDFRFLEAELAQVPFSLEAIPPRAFVPGKPVDVKIVLKNLGAKPQTVQVVRSPQGGLLPAEGFDVRLEGEPDSASVGGKREPHLLKPGASLAGTLRLKGPKARRRVLLSASWSWSPPSTSKLPSSVTLRSIAELSPR